MRLWKALFIGCPIAFAVGVVSALFTESPDVPRAVAFVGAAGTSLVIAVRCAMLKSTDNTNGRDYHTGGVHGTRTAH